MTDITDTELDALYGAVYRAQMPQDQQQFLARQYRLFRDADLTPEQSRRATVAFIQNAVDAVKAKQHGKAKTA